ncbi:Palmitoyltransferase ZDHHC6 [Blattella germanica]|nr:Palmitoyltransferase ZDHHC6 [Blattella germanica]
MQLTHFCLSVMCFGPLRRVCHWGPLTALAIIKSISFMTVHCSNMWWPPAESIGGLLNSAVFLAFSGLTLYNFMSAIYEGPGYLPPQWKPVRYHCGSCGRCVLKMDHHCPWINNCVGHYNHAHFTAFLFWAVCGCLQASIVLSCSLYRALNRVWYLYYGDGTEPIVVLSVYTLVFCVFSLGLSIGVVLAVGMLLYFQVRINTFTFILYTLCFNEIREQQQQKCEKRQRTRTYTAKENYSGSWVPITKGWRVLCHPPFTDEPRIPLTKGDRISVTRWRRYWLFGEKVQSDEIKKRERGWFPRPCAVELVEGVPHNEHDDKNK